MTINKTFKFSLFLITIPGLESLAHQELIHKLTLLNIKEYNCSQVDGGIEYHTDSASDIIALHSYLKIPTKILLRLTSFKAKDFPKLYNLLRKIKWRDYIPWVGPELVFSAYQSKIFDERKVKKCLDDAIAAENVANAPKEKFKNLSWQETPEVYIRFENDLCTVSLNLTGERLDRRGKKIYSTKAPIRESIASAMYYSIIGDLVEEDQTSQINIIDPMSGSGTLLFEASQFYTNNERAFNYQSFPIFREIFSELKKTQIAKIETAPIKINHFFANDLDEKAIDSLKKNLVEYKLTNVSITNLDYKNIVLPELTNKIIICNPPYNKRIKTETDLTSFIEDFLIYLTKLKPQRILIITPTENKTIALKGYKLYEIKPVNNGGIKTKFCLYKLEKSGR